MSVRLRLMRPEDSARVLAWRNSPEVAAYMYSDHQIAPDEHARWFRRALESGDRRYWIVELDDAPVGLASITGIDPANSRCEWAFYLADPAVRGRGVGAAVEYLVLGFVFERRGLNKLWCEVLAGNAAVLRLHERFGFVREALLRDHVSKGGRFHDVVGLGLLAREWPVLRAKAEKQLAPRFEVSRLAIESD